MSTVTTQPTPAARTGRPGGERGSFRPDIEGLRAVAVLAVVLSHAGVPLVNGGYVGVDVFFVISGFLITSLLLKERDRTGGISIKGFYARRATRLLPAAAVVTVATVLGAYLWLPATRFAGIATDALASAFYAINYRLAVTGTDYLGAEAAPSPLQHFWSLAVEEQFYLLWPLLLIVLCRPRGYRRRTIVAVLVAIVMISLAFSVAQTASLAPWAYFGIHTRAWELAIGALMAVFAGRLAALPGPLAAALSWAGLAAIGASVLLYGESTAFPGYAALLPVLGTAAVIGAGCARSRGGAGLLLNLSPFQFVGKISYGYYLWHWPVLLIGPPALGVTPSLPVNLALVAAALLPTLLSFYFVENPVRHRASLKKLPWRGIGLGVGLTAAMASLVLLAMVFPPAMSGSGTATDADKAMAQAESPEAAMADLLAEATQADEVPANLDPTLADANTDEPAIYPDGCHVEQEDVEAPDDCVYGDTTADKTVVLIGDSHAAQWFPTLDAIAAEQGWKLLPRTKSSCSAPTVMVYNATFKRDYSECVQWRDAVLDEVRDIAPELVIMSSSDADGNQPVNVADPRSAWVNGWVDAYERVRDDGTELAYIADTPWATTDVPDCLASHLTNTGPCTQSLADATKQPERRKAAAEAVAELGVSVIDPSGWFCVPGAKCPVIVGNVLVYRDGHHMTTDYAELLAPLLSDELPKL